MVLLAQSGDRNALESVLREVQTDLLRYITGVVGSSGAEDVLQDVFLRIKKAESRASGAGIRP